MKNNQSVRKLTEEEIYEPNESSSESDKDLKQRKETQTFE